MLKIITFLGESSNKGAAPAFLEANRRLNTFLGMCGAPGELIRSITTLHQVVHIPGAAVGHVVSHTVVFDIDKLPHDDQGTWDDFLTDTDSVNPAGG